MLTGNTVGDCEDVVGLPDGVVGEGALVEVGRAVHGALRAEGFVAGHALLAVTARVVLIAPSNGITLAEGLD